MRYMPNPMKCNGVRQAYNKKKKNLIKVNERVSSILPPNIKNLEKIKRKKSIHKERKKKKKKTRHSSSSLPSML